MFLLRSFTCTVRLLFHSLLERVRGEEFISFQGQGGEKRLDVDGKVGDGGF